MLRQDLKALQITHFTSLLCRVPSSNKQVSVLFNTSRRQSVHSGWLCVCECLCLRVWGCLSDCAHVRAHVSVPIGSCAHAQSQRNRPLFKSQSEFAVILLLKFDECSWLQLSARERIQTVVKRLSWGVFLKTVRESERAFFQNLSSGRFCFVFCSFINI